MVFRYSPSLNIRIFYKNCLFDNLKLYIEAEIRIFAIPMMHLIYVTKP